MRFVFQVEVEIEKTTGKFAARESAFDAIQDALESANPDSLALDDSEYSVVTWDISEVPDKPAKRPVSPEEI